MLTVLPLVAAALAVPQLLPQLLRLLRGHPAAGVSPTWASLTAASNAGWLAYFSTTRLWTGTVPAVTCGLIAVGIVVLLHRQEVPVRRGVLTGVAWVAVLAGALLVAGADGLGGALTVAFLLQVTPSLCAAWTAGAPVGVSRGTWLLIGGEVVCWGAVGLLDARLPLIVLGGTGVVAVVAMLWLTRPARTATPLHLTPAGCTVP